ncbi:1,25-dihydroxyvitamin D(3) 24-hydroxylase, mitochondrial-like [Ptychodera flava]|uniref:1,25-dihydroxyvitamin D(3) 24-hydroxylase, mitochondrial-like n=1 Tax=Ptychodera flava TaxID=63121 RepID=UPI003969EF35
MACARLSSSSASRALPVLPHGISPIANTAPFFVRCSRLQCYSTAADHAAVQERNDVVKPFSEMPGKGSETLTGRLTYAFQGWSQRNTVKKPWDRYSEWNEKYGPVYKRVFGNTAMVYVTDPEDIAVVCRNEGKYPTRYTDRLDMFHAWKVYKRQRNIPFGLMTTNGPAWFQRRTALNKKMLRPIEVPKYGGVVNDVVTDLIEKIRRVREADNVVPEFQMLMYTWAIESISAILFNKRLHLFGETVSTEANNFINGFLDVSDTCVTLFKFPASVQSALRTKPWRKHVKGWDAVFDYVIKRIDEKMAEVQLLEEKGELPSPENLDIVQHLLLHSDLSTDMIYSQMTEVFMGAVDTTANTFQWAVYNLASNPEKQEKLREEVRRTVPKGEPISYKHIEEIPYVTAVIKETLRVNPVVVNNSRVLDKDITIKGYNIPAGTPIVMLFHQSGRNSKYFEDPDQFKPERWLTKRSDKLSSFTSMPFGFGPRMCIGKRFAMLELQVLLARISQDFSLENSRTVEPKMSILMVPDRPLNPKFIDR